MSAGGAKATMRAAVFVGPRRVAVTDVPRPSPRAGEVRVRVEGCGVCASNLDPWEGLPWTRYPFEPGAPGHEAWGRVDAVGAAVAGLQAGDRVALVAGCSYAEYVTAPEECVVALPPALDGVPFPAEAFGCALNVFARSRIARGDDVAIVGAGFLGLVLTRLAHRAGAHVIAVSRRPFALAAARRLGAAATVALRDRAEVVREVRALTGGRGCARVIEATGKQQPLDVASEITAERGTLVIAGYHQDGPRLVDMQSWNWRGIDVVNAHERDPRVYVRGMAQAAAMAASGELDPAALVTHAFSLDDVSAALALTQDRPDGFVKAWVRP